MGKGRALKTAFNYILVHRPESLGAITVDSDGQHTIEDTLACVTALIDHPDSLIMGCRNFSKENIPFRSRFGNIVTKHVLHALCGIRISDTQTGLRGIPRRIIPTFLAINGERFEYEMNMLIETKEKGIPIFEVPIQTIYLEENKSSHFNPLKDSAKIYAVFLKFIFSSLSSFAVDIVLFSILVSTLKTPFPVQYILLSTIGARFVSSLFNYYINKNKVFKDPNSSLSTFCKYCILCVAQLALSAFGVSLCYNLLNKTISETLIKIAVDTVLFIISFQIQREWVFKRKR